jgi:hypothetical protein
MAEDKYDANVATDLWYVFGITHTFRMVLERLSSSEKPFPLLKVSQTMSYEETIEIMELIIDEIRTQTIVIVFTKSPLPELILNQMNETHVLRP